MFKPAIRAPEQQKFQKPYQCGICHGDHPTHQCALKPSQPPQFQNKLWCDYERRWTNHNTEGCWQRMKHLREQEISQQNQGNFRAGGEKSMPVLGHQPPLPGNAAVRIVSPEEEGNDRAIVPVQPYSEESHDKTAYSQMQMVQDPTYAPETEASYQMDHNTLMFIANQGMGRPMPNPNQRLFKPADPGPCYGCGGDHWYGDCPD